MKDREKLIRAFEPVKAPEDTLERVLEKAGEKKSKRGFRQASLALACALVICFFGAGGYAAKQFTISRAFLSNRNATKAAVQYEAPAAAAEIAAAPVPAPAFASFDAAVKSLPEEAAADEALALAQSNDAVKSEAAVNGFFISCPFGYENPYTQMEHSGMDFAAEEGTSVLAAADGTVVKAEFDVQKGNYIEIGHEGGYATVYCNLKEMYVQPGDTVRTGDKIGTVGKTGMATGPHLHLELLQAGEPVDPTLYWEN